MRRIRTAALLFVLLFLLSACGESTAAAETPSAETLSAAESAPEEAAETENLTAEADGEAAETAEVVKQGGGYEIPPFRNAVLNE